MRSLTLISLNAHPLQVSDKTATLRLVEKPEPVVYGAVKSPKPASLLRPVTERKWR